MLLLQLFGWKEHDEGKVNNRSRFLARKSHLIHRKFKTDGQLKLHSGSFTTRINSFNQSN